MLLFANENAIAAFIEVLNTRYVGQHIDYEHVVTSTNDRALQRARREDAPHGALFLAEVQYKGRGRRGSAWVSPQQSSLLLSVLIHPKEIEPADIGWVPLASGLACADAVSASCGIAAQIKWPNDIVIPAGKAPGWRKLGGILCESVLPAADSKAQGYVVIGIGINVNQTADELPEVAKAPPTSIRLETGKDQFRPAILRDLLRRLESRIDQLCSKSKASDLKLEVEARLHQWWNPQRQLQVKLLNTNDADLLRGTFAGLDSFGRLKVKDNSGREHVLADAEVISAV